jgi:hypothetical protein
MDMYKKIMSWFRKHVLNKSFLLGILICLSFFSKYIFGDDNLLEELGEWELSRVLGIQIDFSPPDGKSCIRTN